MNRDLTDITLVVDRSGSMEAIRADAEGGVNAFVRQQAELPGRALITLVQFDTEYEFLARGVPVQDCPRYTLVPRGSTALLDAVGRAINETGARLSQLPEADRPGLVIFVVMTDGEENSSQEFTKAQIKTMIQRQTDQYAWQFTFLGADQDAFAEAESLGINADGAACFAMQRVSQAYAHTGNKVARMRGQLQRGEKVDNNYTAEERQDMA
jgi:Mg-chelatase subunit ChlD